MRAAAAKESALNGSAYSTAPPEGNGYGPLNGGAATSVNDSLVDPYYGEETNLTKDELEAL